MRTAHVDPAAVRCAVMSEARCLAVQSGCAAHHFHWTSLVGSSEVGGGGTSASRLSTLSWPSRVAAPHVVFISMETTRPTSPVAASANL